MVTLIPNSWGSDDLLQEFNKCHEPGGSSKGGQFCSTEAPILQGVDSAANRDALVRQARLNRNSIQPPKDLSDALARLAQREHRGPVSPEAERLTEATLRALPLIHGTSVAGAVGAAREGLKSHADLQKNVEDLQQDMEDLRGEIEERLGGPVADWNALEEVADDIDDPEDAEKIRENLRELSGIQRVIAGATYDSDRKLGLDQFVFMTHGELHQDYGPLGVVIDNEVLRDGGWATPRDIFSLEEDSQEYDPETVEDYKETIVKGDDYFPAAAAQIGNVKNLVSRTREQLWEIKASRVPKEDVLGFVVHDDLDLAIRLRDRLGKEGRILYISEPHSGEHPRWVLHQMKHIQRTGSWDEDHAKARNETGGGGEIFIL